MSTPSPDPTAGASPSRRIREPWVVPALGALLLLGLLFVTAAWWWREAWTPVAGETLGQFWEAMRRTHPLVFFGALAIVPAFPIPISPFYLIAAGLYGFWFSYACIAVAVALNLSLSFWVAHGVFRPAIVRVVHALGYRVPSLREGEYGRVTLAVRMTPGPPYFAQNLMLGLAGIPFGTYMAVSWPTQMGWAFIFLVLGESATEGSVGLAIAGVGLIVAATLITRMVRRRLAEEA